MAAHYPVARTARRITYKFQTHDVRKYILEDVVMRTRRAVSRAGGELRGGVYGMPKHIKRWCVNRSPHVNKKSREHFWLVTHRRVYRWDAGPEVDLEAPSEISKTLPATIAIRVAEERPGLMCLKDVWDTLNVVREPVGKQANGEAIGDEIDKGGAASQDAGKSEAALDASHQEGHDGEQDDSARLQSKDRT